MKPFLTALVLLLAAQAHAADPTRPPEAWLSASPTSEDATTETGQRLQSVLIPQHGHPVAVIGGKTVVQGGMLGDQRLVRLTEREAVLKGPEGVTHLYLTPEVEKRMVASPKSRPAKASGHAKDLP